MLAICEMENLGYEFILVSQENPNLKDISEETANVLNNQQMKYNLLGNKATS